jgi:hypothetical protein
LSIHIAKDKDDKNGRKFSRYIRSKTKNMTGIGPLKNSTGTLITENSEMAEELNKFFTSVFTKDSSHHIPYLSEILEQSTNLLTLSEKKIKDKIDGLRKDAAAGPDGLTPMFLRTMGDSILKPLVLIYKISMLEGKCRESGKVPQ